MNVRDAVPELDGDPAFPIYGGIYCVDHITESHDYEPGRVILTLYDSDTGRVDDRLVDLVGPNDIVFIPLYAGLKLNDRWITFTTEEKNDHYEENIKIIQRIGPEVRGILLGNAGPELTFKQFWLQGNRDLQRRVMSEIAAEFVQETAEIIKASGAQPFYGTIDWDLAIDCYFGDRILIDAINAVGGVQIIFAGYQLFGIHMHGPSPIVPHPDDTTFFPACPKMEMMPKPKLQEYLRSGEFWSGVLGANGLCDGNDISLYDYGFSAGVMGWPGTQGL